MNELLLFIIVGGVAVVAAMAMIFVENTVYSALFLILNFVCVAFLYLMLEAPFLSMIQLAVYAGAIMVLFLFVIMLLGADQAEGATPRPRWASVGVIVLALLFAAAIGLPFTGLGLPPGSGALQLTPPTADDSLVRVIHGATDVGPVIVNLSGDGGDFALSDVDFAATSDFVHVPAGDYTVQIQDAETGTILIQSSVTLAAGSTQTFVAYGEGVTGITLGTVADNVAAVQDGDSRLIVFNGISEAPVSLVDLGTNRRLDTGSSAQTTEEGTAIVTAEGGAVTSEVVLDEVLITDVPFGEGSVEVAVDEGNPSLAFITTTSVETVSAYADYEREADATFDPAEAEAVDVEVTDGYATVLTVSEYDIQGGRTQVLVLTAEDLGGDQLTPRIVSAAVAVIPSFGSPELIGQVLFTDYVLPFQLVAILLLVAMIGAIVLSQRESFVPSPRLRGRRRVSRPLASVIAAQTGHEIGSDTPQLEAPEPTSSGD